jgi:DNA-3-methyladenine glycosylase II
LPASRKRGEAPAPRGAAGAARGAPKPPPTPPTRPRSAPTQSRSVATPEALAHLRGADPVLRALIDEIGPDGLGDTRRGLNPEDHYGALVRSIVGPQLSTRAARAINTRLNDRFGGRPPTPAEVLADDPVQLRAAAGLSRAKVSFLRSLAEHVTDGSLELDRLDELPDEAVIAELVAVKGLGTWTAHMFLMFHLQRPDVLPVGDLGIRRAIMQRYGLAALPAPAEMEQIAEPWRPYRTLACLYLWRSLAATPV